MSGSVSISISEAPTTGLGRLIMDNRFFVPTHQRDYKWDRERVDRFIEDLTQAMERGDKFYFVGLMVFMGPSDGRLRVLDGQQRLATAIIIFSVLRSWLALAGQTGDSSRLQYDFIGRADYGELRPEPKLSLNRNNDDSFQRYVTASTHIDPVKADLKATGRHDPNYALLDAIVFCHQRIVDKVKEFPDQESARKHFNDLIRFIRDAVIVVRLTVPNESNAFRVFETLNDRGMDLSAIDLLKNYLFGCVYENSESDLFQMEHRWSQLTQALQNLRQEDFLKVYWTSRHGLILLDDIFEEVKKICKTAPEAERLSNDLLDAAEHYAALDEPGDPVWASYRKECRILIGNLRVLGSKLVRPVILSGLKKMAAKEFEGLLWLLEVVIVRWQLIGEGRTGVIERQCARLAEGIWSGRISTWRDAFEAIKEIYTHDNDFEAKFALQDNLSNPKAVYLLKKIENFERENRKGSIAKELSPDALLTLEHVFPRSPSSDWSDVTESDPAIAECTTRLGNFCMLTEPKNREAGRLNFAKKRKLYEASELFTTQEIAKAVRWDRVAIESHQKWLASKAVQIWKI